MLWERSPARGSGHPGVGAVTDRDRQEMHT
jgi:hypothetical protein